jgi:hypothetical protein
MKHVLGHLAQFASLSRQAELLCTQGLSHLLTEPEARGAFNLLIESLVDCPVEPCVAWHAESRQLDGGRPDLEGRLADGMASVKVEAKLGAPFGRGQLRSYRDALATGSGQTVLLLVVPRRRYQETVEYVQAELGVPGSGPWRSTHDRGEVLTAAVTWEQVFEALEAVASASFRSDLEQLTAMYQVFNGDIMEPLADEAEVLAWREREPWWKPSWT